MSGGGPSWERLALWMIALAIALQLLAGVLPRLVVPVSVLIGVVILARLVWFFTNWYR